MPSKSVRQRNFFQLVLAVKEGKKKRTEVSTEVLKAADSMSLQDIKDFANTTDAEIEKERKKTNESLIESLSTEDKKNIENFVKNFKGDFDDSEVHDFADKYDLNIHEVEAYVYSLARKLLNEGTFNEISGGKGDSTDSKDVDPNELAVGIEVELEHTDDRNIATEIAIDHLTEKPNYYTLLIKSGIVDEEPALKKYKELFGDDPKKYVKESTGQVSVDNVSGIGKTIIPESPLDTTKFSSQKIGSGDLIDKKKKKKKLIHIKPYDKFETEKTK